MPSFYQHIILAVSVLIVFLVPGSPQYASLLLAFFVSSVFPDIDSKNSSVRKSAALVVPSIISLFVVLTVNSNIQTKIFAGIVALFTAHILMDSLPLSHRGRHSMHRKSVMLVFSLFFGFIIWKIFKTPDLWQLVMASFLGYFMHLVSDKIFNKGQK